MHNFTMSLAPVASGSLPPAEIEADQSLLRAPGCVPSTSGSAVRRDGETVVGFLG